jgi:hypothetical protein
MNEQLPIPDYDNLPIGSLSHRIRALNAEGVAAILRYERAHADRVQLVEVLARRLDALRSGEAEPSAGDPAAAQPEHAPPAEGGSPVPTTSTTDNNQPLRHGVAGQTRNGIYERAERSHQRGDLRVARLRRHDEPSGVVR